MQVDVIFDNAKVYDVNRMEVAQGQNFQLITDYTAPSRWFLDNDEVLSAKVRGNNAELSANEKGTSTLLIMDEQFQTIKTLTISVVDAVVSQATDLGLHTDEPTDK
jgi:membrane carboxypeptidase/penicillin-binding protein PbpC